MGLNGIKWDKIGTIAYMILMVFYGIYTMVNAIQAYSRFSDTTQTYLNIAGNLGSQFIVDVQTSTTDCPSGYSTIFDWDWQGSVDGCDCTSSNYKTGYKVVSSGSCNSTQIAQSCKQVAAQKSVFFNAIQGASNQKELVCIKRGVDSFAKVAVNQTGTCTSTQKTCGNPSKKETVICVNSADPCPIYDLKYSASIDLTTYPTPDWKQFNLASGSYLYVNIKGSQAQSLPLSEFRFTQSGVCKVENTEKKLPNGAKDYILVKTTRNSCDETDDTFVKTNFQIAENKYYEINVPSSQWTTMKAWSKYDVPTAAEPFYSFERAFINWKIEERDSLEYFVNASESVKDVKSAQLASMIINIIVCILVSILLQASQVYNLLGKDVPCIPGRGSDEQQLIVLIKKVLNYGSKLLMAPFLLWAFILSADKKDTMNDIASTSPSDPRFNSEISAFANQLSSDVYKKNLNSLLTLCATVAVDLLLLLRVYLKSRGNSSQGTIKPMDEEDTQKQTMGAPQNVNEVEIVEEPKQSGQLMNPNTHSSFSKQNLLQVNPPQEQPLQQVVYVQPVIIQQPVYVIQEMPLQQS